MRRQERLREKRLAPNLIVYLEGFEEGYEDAEFGDTDYLDGHIRKEPEAEAAYHEGYSEGHADAKAGRCARYSPGGPSNVPA